MNTNLKNFKSFCGKRNASDCAGIQARICRLPVDCSNQLIEINEWIDLKYYLPVLMIYKSSKTLENILFYRHFDVY